MLNIFKKEPEFTTPIDVISGPRSDIADCNPCFVRKESDWDLEHGSLTIRQNSSENQYDTDGDRTERINIRMTEDDIVKFVSEYSACNLTHETKLVIMTAADTHDVVLRHICLTLKGNTATIKTSSTCCMKRYIDCNTIHLVQKVLDSMKIKIDFRKELNNWDENSNLEISA